MGFDQAGAFRDCPWCGLRDAQMYVKAAFEAKRLGSSSRYWTAITCPRCGGPTLVETNGTNATIPQNLRVIPEGGTSHDIAALPDDVDSYYRDAIIVLRAGVPDAAAVQLRRTLEAAAAHFQVKEATLVKSIEKLIDQGFVTKSFGDALHHVRKIGNLGAHHTDERVDDAAAQRALLFTTALLRNLFEVPAELAAIKDGEDSSAP